MNSTDLLMTHLSMNTTDRAIEVMSNSVKLAEEYQGIIDCIKDIVKAIPNDADLGAEIRRIFTPKN